MTRAQIIRKIHDAAKKYKQHFVGKTYMFVFNDTKIEVMFKKASFKHLSGCLLYTSGKQAVDKKVLLIEPLEYKEDKVIKDFVIAIDTSGSCAGELVKKFLNKTYSILKESESFASRVNIHIVQCDAAIQNDTKITNMKEMEEFMQNMKLYGFGGTDFRPVFEYVDTLIKNKEFDNLCGLIYFTDGYGTYPTKPTPYKTAFAFLEDYNNREDIPAWAMSVFWNADQE